MLVTQVYRFALHRQKDTLCLHTLKDDIGKRDISTAAENDRRRYVELGVGRVLRWHRKILMDLYVLPFQTYTNREDSWLRNKFRVTA
jgi:hypothetical protein